MSKHVKVKAVGFALMLAVSGASQAGEASENESSVDSLKQETRELGQALQSYGAEQKDQAEDAINRTLDAIDARIETLDKELEENWDDMSELARERSRKSLKSLREQRARVQSWYDELKASSASAWERARQGFSEAYEALSKRWNEAEQQIERDSDKRNNSI